MAAGSRTRPTRIIGSGARAGESLPVDVDTHVAGVLVHHAGAISTLTMSFDVVATTSAPIEVHGESASMLVPDPNRFDGTVRLKEAGDDAWRDVADAAGYVGVGRGIGVIDMVRGEHRANAEVALHVLDVIESLTRSSTERTAIEPTTTVNRPE